MITLIAACARSADGRLVIGKDGGIPWHLPEDLRRFQKRTTGHVIVMGRKTYESLPVRPLPGRRTIVLTKNHGWIPSIALGSRTLAAPQISVCHDPLDIVAEFLMSWKKVFICGGADIYQQFLPYCTELDITLIDHEIEGDTFFPLNEHEILEKFQSQFIEVHDKSAGEAWGEKPTLRWRHIIYGGKFLTGQD